jgi:hypothetical protein
VFGWSTFLRRRSRGRRIILDSIRNKWKQNLIVKMRVLLESNEVPVHIFAGLDRGAWNRNRNRK